MTYLLTGFGLSGSAGLNAYLPLLVMGVMHHLDLMKLTDPYDKLASYPILALLTLLLLIEMVADKIPAVDSLNDVIQSLIRPTAGAILFTASTANVEGIDPTLLFGMSILSGSVSAGSVHGIKALVRPGVTLTTGGIGNIVVSLLEDVVSFWVSTLAILIPVVVVVFALSGWAIVVWWLWDRRRTQLYFGEKPKRNFI